MNLYGFFYSDGRWTLARGGRQRERIKQARELKAAVHVLRNAWGWGTPHGWDAPTFRVTADQIADYREVSK